MDTKYFLVPISVKFNITMLDYEIDLIWSSANDHTSFLEENMRNEKFELERITSEM